MLKLEILGLNLITDVLNILPITKVNLDAFIYGIVLYGFLHHSSEQTQLISWQINCACFEE